MTPGLGLARRLPDRISDLQERERHRGEAVADRFLLPRRPARFMSCLYREVPVVTHVCSSRRRTATYNTAGGQYGRGSAAGDNHMMMCGKRISRSPDEQGDTPLTVRSLQ